jgi:hypothetical protein
MATTKECVQVALEESPRYEGVSTGTPHRISTDVHYLPIQSARILPVPAFMDRADELRGTEGAPPQLIDGYSPAGSINIRAYLNSLTWLLECSGLAGTHTAGDGSTVVDPDSVAIPVGAHKWVYAKRGGKVAQTMQVRTCYANDEVFLKGQGFGVQTLNLDGSGEVSADLLGLVVAKETDPNLTPALDAASILPLRRGDLSFSWLTSSGTTRDFSLSLTNPLLAERSYAVASFFPDNMWHGDDKVRLGGSMPKATFAVADYDALVAGTTFAATAKWKSSKVIGATTYTYSMWIEMPACQYVSGEQDEIANRRRFGGSFDWQAAWDESAGYDFRITVVNAVTSVATYA